MKHRLIELGKSLLILLLILAVAALTLLVSSQGQMENVPLVSSMRTALGLTGAEATYAVTETTTYEAARPDTIVVTTLEGHSTVTRSFDQISTAFDVLGRYLSEALETAAEPEAVSQDVWQVALEGQGVYFHYWGEIPLAALADWFRASLGTATLEAAQTGRLLLSLPEDGDTVTLYYATEDGYWRCETALTPEGLLEQMESYRPDGSIFAFESSQEAVARLDGESALNLASAPVVQNALAANPVETDTDFIQNIATALGFNPYADTGYLASDGSLVYSESECTLSVSTDGVVRFRMRDLSEAAARITAASQSVPDLIEQARATLETLMGSHLGDAKLYVTGFSQADDVTTVTFTYLLNGTPVRISTGDAATVTFTGTVLSSLTIRARTYTLEETTTTLLPAIQAAALVEEGSYLAVEYADNGGESLSCGWMAE